MSERCRCGHEDGDPHPCHGRAYTCRKPATHRIYAPYVTCLAGVQMKLGAYDTWACDECWSEFHDGRQQQEAGTHE